MFHPISHKSLLTLALLSPAIFLAGCGGGGTSQDSSNTSVSRGIITGFGSMYVNGVKFETDDSDFVVDDDENSDQSDLRVGMIVTVHGHINSNGSSGIATRVAYENELKGPISSITVDPADATIKTLTILGHQVLVNADTTFDNDGGLTFDNMANNDVVEISGFTTDSGFTATHIEKQADDSKIEIKGSIQNLTAIGFDINGFDISYNFSTELEDNITLSEGLFVEVKGRLDSAGTTLIASKIEAEDEGLGDDVDEAEIEGMISNYDALNDTFMIQGQSIDASNASLFPSSLVLADDLTVEAEGYIANGMLVAEKIKQKGKKIKISSTVSAIDIDAGTILFTFNGGDIVVRVNQQTQIEDDINDSNLTLATLPDNSYVEIKAFSDGSGDINAIKLELDTIDETRIKAPVEGKDELAQTVTLLGIPFDLSSASLEDDDDNTLNAADFYAALDTGVFIALKDTDSNGKIDKAELED